jgi:chemosensory pili system protein ChpA (sensor histidine kinase/response regulator)
VALVAVHGAQIRAWAEQAVSAATAPAGPAAGQPMPAGHSDIPLVLVVDDSITVRRVTQRLLQREGYRVALAADGLQGLERLQHERPALVLSDIEMPRMDGFDFLRNIRANPAWRELPVVMITSRTAEKHQEHARQLGRPLPGQALLGGRAAGPGPRLRAGGGGAAGGLMRSKMRAWPTLPRPST